MRIDWPGAILMDWLFALACSDDASGLGTAAIFGGGGGGGAGDIAFLGAGAAVFSTCLAGTGFEVSTGVGVAFATFLSGIGFGAGAVGVLTGCCTASFVCVEFGWVSVTFRLAVTALSLGAFCGATCNWDVGLDLGGINNPERDA